MSSTGRAREAFKARMSKLIDSIVYLEEQKL